MASFNGEVLHAAAVRFVVAGEGNLRTTLESLGAVKSKVVTPVVMQVVTDIEPTKVTNFVSQRIAIQIETTAIDEYFSISKIMLFVKPIATGWPGSSN